MRRIAAAFAVLSAIAAAPMLAATVRRPAPRIVQPTDVDLGVTKSTPSNTVTAGSTVQFNITVTNAGPGTATNATLTDTLPSGLTFVSIDSSGAAGFTCGNSANVITCTIPTFGTGTPADFVLTATVDPQGAPGTTYTNIATVSSSSNDVNSENDSSAAAVTIAAPQADVSIVKTGPSSAAPGSTVSYTIAVKNSGPDAASDVAFTDTLPGTMTFTSLQQDPNSPPFSCATPAVGSGGTITCTIATLAAGTTAVFTLSGTVPANTASGTTFDNAANVSTSTNDPNMENNSSTTSLTVASADLSVVKSGPATVNAGSTISWTITVTNIGPDFAENAGFIDALPAGTTFASVTQNSGTAATCTTPAPNANGTVICTWPFLGVSSAQFTLTANVLGSAASSISNTAQVSSDTTDPNPNNNSSTVTTSVTPVADVGVAKSGPATVTAGTNLTYTINVTNAGPSTATSVTLTDAIPANTTFVSLTQTAGPAFTCTTTSGVNCQVASLAAAATASFTFVVAVSPGATGTISNTATVSSATTDLNSANNSSTVSTTVQQSADVGVTKSGPATVNAGANLTYTINVTNSGPSTASGVTLTDAIPANTTFVSLTQTAGPAFTCTTTSGVNCQIASLAPASTASFTFVVAVNRGATGTISNTATISSATADPNAANNTSTVSTTVQPIADVGVTKSGPATVTAGTNLTYTINVTNAGPSTANTVTLTDAIPANTTFVSLTQTAGPAFTCTTTSGVNCQIASLAAATTASFTFVVAVSPGATGTISNTATVGSATADPNAANNTSAVNTIVQQSADVGVTKSGPATVTAGTNLTYTVNVTNAGPSTATSVTLTDAIPANTTFVSLTQTAGPAFTCTTTSGVNCQIASLAPAASASFTLIVAVSPGASGTVSNTATIGSATADPNAANNTSTVITPVQQSADVSVTKSAPANAAAGSNVTYTITVANAGPSDAAGVSMTDTLPANTTFVSLNQTGGPAFNCTTGATVTCSIATLTRGASATFSLVAAVNPLLLTGTISNTASVASTTADPNSGNNTSTASTAISPAVVDLSITKTANQQLYAATYPLNYTIVATNNGPSAAQNVVVTDVLPAGTTFVSASSTAGTCSGTTTVTCNVGTLAANTSATITLTLTPSSTGPLTNTATVSTSNVDSNPANNTATATVTVGGAASIPALDGYALLLLAAALVAIAVMKR